MANEKFTDERFTLTDEKAAIALDVLRQRLNQQLEAALEVCVRCGVCANPAIIMSPTPSPNTFRLTGLNNCAKFIAR